MNTKDSISTLDNRANSMGLISNLIHKSGSADVTRPQTLDFNRSDNVHNEDQDKRQLYGYRGNNSGYRGNVHRNITDIKTSSELKQKSSQISNHHRHSPSPSPVTPSTQYCYPSQVNSYIKESPSSALDCSSDVPANHAQFKNNLPPGTPILQVHDRPSSQQQQQYRSYTPPPPHQYNGSSRIPVMQSSHCQISSVKTMVSSVNAKCYADELRSSQYQSSVHLSRDNTLANQSTKRTTDLAQPSTTSRNDTDLSYISPKSLVKTKKLTAWLDLQLLLKIINLYKI